MKNRFLLIMGCSQKKNPSINPMKAIDRYTGLFFKVLKKNNSKLKDLDVIIISAKYGFLLPGSLIENYDMKLTNKRALELRDEISPKFYEFFKDRNYDEVFINLGKYYSKATYYCSGVNANKWIVSKGAIGEKMSQLKNWLIRIQKKEGLFNFLIQTSKMEIENESN